MKLGRVLLLTLVLVSLVSMSVWADDVYQNYKAKPVKLSINGKETKDNGLQLEDGKTMLPFPAVSDTLQALTKWDARGQTLQVYKPNVHIFPFQVSKRELVRFGTVFKGKYEFFIETQVDNLQTSISSLKINIVDPFGNTVYGYIYEDQLKDVGEEFWLTTEPINLDFKHTGKYTIKVYMKMSPDSEYALVSEKVIRSKNKGE
ncbi:hypothetical protein DUZ99_04245 [Xylanibacillus composti]|uniref:Copper amine oxidase-like N-terminal domain-containing protein n=1 Tax=Xylanibacillus composti TaxID=1572762 RepID=A0A8J4M1W6_9BACL|nr:hypothetical protein [Xylanibacillus composti]MDT9724198.1 hypothetical protein [Xylanibacillus composti]GIQ68287.1 hypothetical protein XYCOK13_11110 [Xylanibacillus composti]